MSGVRVIYAIKKYALPLVLGTTLIGSSAQAEGIKAKQISIKYQATLSGVFIGEAKLRIAVTNQAYNIAGSASASGVLKNLYGFSLDVKSHGALANHTMYPSNYSTEYGNATGKRAVNINYDRQGKAAVTAKPKFYPSSKRVALKPAHYQRTLDPLSALFLPVKRNLSALSPENCNRVMPVFDGRVRYNLKMSATSQKELKRRPRGFKGPLLNCKIQLIPVAGHPKKRGKAQDFETRQEIDVWLTPIESAGLLIPIKGRIPTPLGVAEINARRIYLNGQKVAAL